MYIEDYKILLKRIILAFIFFPFARLLFLYFNKDYFLGIEYIDIFIAFLYGLRFDLSAMLIANSIFIILSVIPFRKPIYEKLLKFVFVIFNSAFFVVNLADVEFFKFVGRKVTIDIFDMGSDISNQAFQLIFYYWYLSLLFIFFFFCLMRFYPKAKKNFNYKKKVSLIKTLPLGFLIVVVTFIGIRGGLQLRSISPKQAYVFDHYELGNLVLNSSYTLIRSLGKKKVPEVTFFKSDKNAKELILQNRNFENSSVNVKSNVVIVILESFSYEYFENGYMPFLKELSEQSLFVEESYANGRRSIEALPSILTGLPSLLKKPIYQSQFQSNQFIGLPQILKESGYETSFFHGGKKGTMDFDAYCSSVGITKYYSMEDYPNQSHFDGNWGIYDHYYLQFFHEELNKFKEPFFTSIFTLSSHQPYSIPISMKGKFNKGNLEIHESIQYVDSSMRDFFEKIKNESWYSNTLFVITADHTQKLETKKYNNLLGRYRVPLMFFHPTTKLNKLKRKNIGQHVDILPTVIDFLGINFPKKLLFGSSLLNKDSGRMINLANNTYIFLRDDQLLRYNGESFRAYSRDSGFLDSVDPNKDYIQEFKAYIQYFTNGMKRNSIYD